MDKQVINYALDEFERTEPGHIDIIEVAREELNAPVPQSTRNVAADFLSHMELPNRKLSVISLAHEIEYYADSRGQEALEKERAK